LLGLLSIILELTMSYIKLVEEYYCVENSVYSNFLIYFMYIFLERF